MVTEACLLVRWILSVSEAYVDSLLPFAWETVYKLLGVHGIFILYLSTTLNNDPAWAQHMGSEPCC